MNSRLRGLTTIELLITISIISLLIASAAIGINRARRNGRDAQRIADISALANAINLSVSTNNGYYPSNVSSRSQSISCVKDLAQPGDNPNKLDLTLFSSGQIPKDPLPKINDGTCGDYLHGYIYHNRYGSGSSLIKSAVNENWEYALEVGLEGERHTEEQTLQEGTKSDSDRTQYIYYGKYCGLGTSNTCVNP